ncbi:S1C family serine protease [Paenarthrobacter aurescens]|uniref:Peptidase S1 n=1 Tax=Paenarthrobacter aurescens TaxID=43663 RepID=A0A4Y3NGN2_PAEAU|nr:trypsin-like peptidase domain-containing protein [Paenarthrobacter aurescens]MDO6144146.1 trypsin-like peptidase domain-containing protein [Paenarthrobacter aurescens]MDO6147993.1 trypsin-like peptidase domain-containing protein [Paenarthrobacter aurescens]MDO6159237.1 trypsin-like peptidase domain-containing protein [Paenarthrobacter aurescens]MDO6163221.1 trypsin-like peptidase domain-containing protein [Paenarthrobacter aurescens]GEB18296.1 peptidase S1 [Paenarthrobacter aurescens]
MTENPAQGTAPEDRQPSEPRENSVEQGDAGANLQQPARTSGQGAAADGGAQPTTPLPAFQPPAAPQQPQQPQYYGAPQQHDPAHRPSYPQHQPFYGGANPEENAAAQYRNQQEYPNQQQYQNQQGFQNAQGHNSPGMHHTPGHSSAVATKRKPAFGVGTLVASMLAAGLIGGGVVAGSNALWDNPAPAASNGGQSSTVIVNNKDDVNVITAAAAKASPSVVTIKATSGNEGGTGSGIILDDQGHILTNTHVVTLDGATANAAIEVRTSDGKVLKATVVGTDPLSDLAVIKVSDASGLVPATLGDSSKINVGDTAVAIGSPLGLTGTVTDGIVSTLNRTISVASSAVPEGTPDESQGDDEGFQFAPPNGGQSQRTANEGSIAINVIQTDAAINPGNSGGALVNSKGEVIGVNVAIASAGSGTSESSSGNIGVGFSVPINHAKRVAQEIIETGKASHGQFGVSVRSKSSTGGDSGFSVGAEVASVTSGSAAAKAGLKVGDVVTKFGDYAVSDPNQLTAAVREQPAGAKVKVTIQRGGQTQEVEVTLDAAQ